ncbi:hypothetical protein BKA65DRAFT_552948 [Rhexocercosporidium sp. MPI-PUGE-AT-0058]|nr:hypothetical protein BKA65DRAFT_552948 [Rhexocercosporidium sp. MPI-PUGE-AT-0058]
MGLLTLLQKFIQGQKEKKQLRQRKAKEESASTKFIKRHAKKCPKCRARLEKEDGCDHMDCRCGYSFCWICLKQWGLQYHKTSCMYRLRKEDLAALLRERPKDQGMWLQNRGMALAQGEGVLGMYDEYDAAYVQEAVYYCWQTEERELNSPEQI